LGPVGQLEDPLHQDGLDGPVQQGRPTGFGRELVCGEARTERVRRLILRIQQRCLEHPERVPSRAVRDPGDEWNNQRAIERGDHGFALPRVTPLVKAENATWIVPIQEFGAVTRAELRKPVGSLAEHRDLLKRALDILIDGI
jgi:hypothetical protein